MESLGFRVNGTALVRTDLNKVIRYTRNYLRAEFEFIQGWSDVSSIVANFTKDGVTYSVFVEENFCNVPWEVLENEGSFLLSLSGGDLLMTEDVEILVYGSGVVGGLVPTVASPGLYDYVLEKVDGMDNLVITDKVEATNIEADNITSDNITSENITSDNIASNSITANTILVKDDEEFMELSPYGIRGSYNTLIDNIDRINTTDLNVSNDIYVDGNIDAKGSISCDDLNASGIVYAGEFSGDSLSLTKASAIPEIKNSFSTSTYNNVETDLKFSKSGFNLKSVSTKTSDGSVYTNEIKTSNSKITVNANDFEVASVKNIKLNSESTATINGKGVRIQNSGDDKIVINDSNTKLNGGSCSVEVGNSNIYINGSNDVNISGKNIRNSLDTVGTFEAVGKTIDGKGSIVRLGVVGEGKTTKVNLGKDLAKIGVYNVSEKTVSATIDTGVEIGNKKVNILGDLYINNKSFKDMRDYIIGAYELQLNCLSNQGVDINEIKFGEGKLYICNNGTSYLWGERTPDYTEESSPFSNEYSETATGNLFIPRKALIRLGSNLFYNCSTLENVVIKDVEEIGSDAFRDSSMKSLICKADKIESGAFRGCTQLLNAEVTAEYISTNTFNYCTGMKTVSLSGVEQVPANTFVYCWALESVNLSGTVERIDKNVFSGLNNLKTITVNKPEGSIADAPWGAVNAEIIWNGGM